MFRTLFLAGFLALAAVAPQSVLAHGDSDQSVKEFHLHLDDYSAEIDAFVAEVASIVDSYRNNGDARSGVDGLIERWEEVAVHGAIETHAMALYPTIWQRILGLQQAVLEGRAPEAVAEAGDELEAALWQGYGALRLAAADVGSGDDAAHAEHDEHHGDHDDHAHEHRDG